MHFCFKLHVIVIFALYFYYVFIILVMSEIQSFKLLLILHYAFDMFVSFVYYFLALYFAVYNNVAMFDLFQHVSKCIWNNFIDVI